MAQDTRKALDEKTRKLTGGKVEEGKEHAAYQESQQQLLAIQAEQQQNLAVARAESKASFDNNQTLAQAAELGAISAAEAEQAAAMGAQAGTQLNPATQQILSKYGAGQPKFQRSQSHSQQVTKQNITINNSITSNTTNDVKVPANIGGPLQGRPLQFKAPSGEGSVGKFKTWISAAFARQNEEGAKRDREYRHRESSLTRSASKMMKKLEDIGKTIGSRMDPRKIGSTWQSQLKTLLLLFGFGYLTSNWTKVLETVSDIEQWVRNTWNYFSEGNFISDISGLLGGKPGQGVLDSLKSLFLGDGEEKGLFGHLKQFFKDAWEERAEAVKAVKAPEITNALNDPMTAIKSLFEYLSNILTAAFSGTEGIKKIRLEEAGEKVTKKADEYRIKNSTTDNTVKRTVNGEKVDVELGTSAFKKTDYKGTSHHMLEGNELTSKFGAESSVAQMSEITRLRNIAKTTGVYHTDDIAIDLGRLSRFANKQGMIPVNKRDISDILSSEEAERLIASGDLRRNVVYKEVIRPKNDEDYTRNLYGNNGTDPKTSALVSYGVNTMGAESLGGTLGQFRSWGTKMRTNGILKGTLEHFSGDQGTAYGAADLMKKVDEKVKDGKAKYRIEYIREDSPLRRGDIATGNVEVFDELSKEGIKALAKGILSKDNKDFNEETRIDLDDLTGYSNLLKKAASSQRSGYLERRNNEIKKELNNLLGNVINNVPLSPETTSFVLGNYNWEQNKMFNGIEEATKKRINKLRREYDVINSPRFKNAKGPGGQNMVGLDESMSEVAELEAKDKERELQRQRDWDNSAAGRSVTAIGNATYNISGGRWGTHTEKLTAGKSVDNQELKYRKQYLLKLFREKGLSDGAAAGIIGNLEGEGLGKDPSQHFKDPTKNDSNAYSQGIAMFNSSGELPNLQAWAKKNGLNYNTFEAQAQYVANHSVIDKILRETQGLNPQDSLKKSAIIWGHDFERFKGHDAADSHGNLIGRGAYISVQANSKDKYRDDGKFHGDENYAERIQKGLNTYNTYSGSDLSEITLESSRSFKQEDNEETAGGKSKPKSFLEIFKEKVTSFITNLGGIFSAATDKVNEVTSPIVDKVKDVVLTDGYHYNGPITKEFTDYETYKMNQDKLPKDLPSGLSYDDWKNRVYDMTGSMPQNLDLSPIEASKQKAELKKDSKEKEIIEKYSKPEETSNWVNSPEFKSKFELEAEDEKYREMIPLINDPVFRNSLTETEIAKVESLKAEGVKPVEAKKEEPETVTPSVTEVPSSKVDVAESSYKDIWNTVFNTQSYEKKEDEVKEISVDTKEIKKFLGQILGVNSANGMIMAQNVDATNNGARANAGAFMGLAKQIATDSANRTKLSKELRNVEDNKLA